MNIYRVINVSSFILITFVCMASAEPITAAIIAGGFMLGGGLINAWATNRGMDKQLAENRRAEGINIAEANKIASRSAKLTAKQMKIQQSQFGENLALEKEKFGEDKKQSKFNNLLTLKNNMWQQLAAKPQMKNNMISIWRNRRAA